MGNNRYGQCGLGVSPNVKRVFSPMQVTFPPTPEEADPIIDFVAAVKGRMTLVVTRTNRLFAFGINKSMLLGNFLLLLTLCINSGSARYR